MTILITGTAATSGNAAIVIGVGDKKIDIDTVVNRMAISHLIPCTYVLSDSRIRRNIPAMKIKIAGGAVSALNTRPSKLALVHSAPRNPISPSFLTI